MLISLPPKFFKPTNTPFFGFSKCNVQPIGEVTLLMITNIHSTQATILTNLLVVYTLFIYNIIIRCAILNALRAISSTYHLTMKLPITMGMRVI